ncbi:hypothetical protein GCK32_020264, partial [Trichostrongylus colubriformis]
MTDVINGFDSANVQIRRIWVKKVGIDVGFYTNRRNWNETTKEWNPSGHPLWYWNVREVGPGGETPADFKDFRPFGSWTDPTVKQFAKKEEICGVTVN